MKTFSGRTLSWQVTDGVIELLLDREPCNEIGSATLPGLQQIIHTLPSLQKTDHAPIISGARKSGFCAGADLRELYHGSQALPPGERLLGVHSFLERIHHVM